MGLIAGSFPQPAALCPLGRGSGKRREGRGRSGPRNVFGVGEGGLAPWAPKSQSVCPSEKRVLCWAPCLLCPAKGTGTRASETDSHLFLSLPRLSISSSRPFNILPFFHSSTPRCYPSVFLSSSSFHSFILPLFHLLL